MEGEWITMRPQYRSLSNTQQSFKVETLWTWIYKDPSNLMNAELYSKRMINALQRQLLFPKGVNGTQSNIAR